MRHGIVTGTCSVAPDWTGKGIGSVILAKLTGDARGMGIDTILAGLSSVNHRSINCHRKRKRGFIEGGSFTRGGKKSGKGFDGAWMQLLV